MPEFAVATHFTVKEQLTSFFINGEKGASRFETMVNGAFRRSGKEASLFKQILGGVTLGNLASSGVQKLAGFIGGIPESLAAMAEKGEALGRTAQIIGVNTEQLQRFNYAAKMSDIPVEGMQTALQKMNKGLGELKVHQGTIETGLKKINPELMYQLRTAKDSSAAFLMVADAMSKTDSAQKRAAIATAVFGKEGQDMIPMLMKGKDGIASLMAETDKYSGIMSGDAIESAAKYADAMKKMDGTMQSLKNAAIAPLLVALTPYIDELVEWVNTNRVLIKTDIKNFVTGLTGAIKIAVPILRTTLGFIHTFGPAVLTAVIAFNLLKYGMLAAATAGKLFGLVNTIMFAFQAVAEGAATKQEALNVVMAANPIGLICTGIAILIGLIVLMVMHWDQVSAALKTAWNWMGNNKEMLIMLLGPLGLVINGIVSLCSNLKAIQASFQAEGIIGGLRTIGSVMLSALIAPMTQFITMLSKIPGVGKFLAPAADALKSIQASLNATTYRNLPQATQNVAQLNREPPRQAPNQAQIDRQESSFNGVLKISGAPAGSTLSKKTSGSSPLRVDLMGANP